MNGIKLDVLRGKIFDNGAIEHFKLADESSHSLTASGSTTVNPGRGNDSVTLTGSDNTYRYTAGDGTDHLTAANNSNLLQITGANPEDLKLKLGSLALQVGDNPENTHHIDSFDPNDPEASAGFGLIQFVDPATGAVTASTSMAALLDQGFEVEGTDGDDRLTGTAVTDRISGFEGRPMNDFEWRVTA